MVAIGTIALHIAGIEEGGPHTTTGAVHPTTATIDTTTTPPGPAVVEIETAAEEATTTTGERECLVSMVLSGV